MIHTILEHPMQEFILILKEIHKDIKSDRPKGSKLNGNAAYRNGFEDGHKLVTKRIKGFIDSMTPPSHPVKTT
jgi:hypothetical protein